MAVVYALVSLSAPILWSAETRSRRSHAVKLTKYPDLHEAGRTKAAADCSRKTRQAAAVGRNLPVQSAFLCLLADPTNVFQGRADLRPGKLGIILRRLTFLEYGIELCGYASKRDRWRF